MTGNIKPYFVRAVHEWCSDNGLTPYLSLRIDEQVQVPAQLTHEQQAVLNIAWDATNDLIIADECISFQARFNGVVHDLLIPISHVLGIFAKENGQGMGFPPEAAPEEAAETAPSLAPLSSVKSGQDSASAKPASKKPPQLRVVK